MSTKKEKEEMLQQEEQVEQKDPEQEQEEVEEEEPVDIELQKEMKKVTIDESVFAQTQSKQKGKTKKKATKKKGQDFLDYASKNNIQINLQYGDDEKHYDSYHKGKNDYSSQYQHQNQGEPQYQKHSQQYQQQPQQSQQQQQQGGMNQKNKYKGGNKYKNNYKSNDQGRKGQIKFGENKFDACNKNMMPYQYGMPNQQPIPYNQQLQYHQDPQHFQQNNQHPYYQPQIKEMTLTTDDQILGYIERLLSLNTLNKDLYLRFRINEKGMINITELANYYGLKNNNVTPQKIIDVISQNNSVASVSVVEENNSIYISIKNWNTISPQLLSIETISAKKKQMKQQQTQMNAYQNQYTPYTYIHMQNNYYIPNQGLPNETNQEHIMPPQQSINHPEAN